MICVATMSPSPDSSRFPPRPRFPKPMFASAAVLAKERSKYEARKERAAGERVRFAASLRAAYLALAAAVEELCEQKEGSSQLVETRHFDAQLAKLREVAEALRAVLPSTDFCGLDVTVNDLCAGLNAHVRSGASWFSSVRLCCRVGVELIDSLELAVAVEAVQVVCHRVRSAVLIHRRAAALA